MYNLNVIQFLLTTRCKFGETLNNIKQWTIVNRRDGLETH